MQGLVGPTGPPVTTNGTFTANVNGFTTQVTALCAYTVVGNICTLFFNSATGTSNSTSMYISNLPAAVIPSSSKAGPMTFALTNNGGTNYFGGTEIYSNGTIYFGILAPTGGSTTGQMSGTGFSASGTKGFSSFCMTYSLA